MILVVVIGFSVIVSLRDGARQSGRARRRPSSRSTSPRWRSGCCSAGLIGANARDSMTLAIETGVQNVTLAIFLTLTVLGSLPLAVTQNIYGVVMILNASLLIRWWRGRIAREDGARMIVVSAEEVARLLPYEECIPLMREAMIALSQGRTQPAAALDPRSAGRPRLRRRCPARCSTTACSAPSWSASIRTISPGGPSHQGVVVLFDPRDRRAVGDARRRRDHRDPHRRRLGRRDRRAGPARRAPASPSSAMASRRGAMSRRSAASARSSG